MDWWLTWQYLSRRRYAQWLFGVPGDRYCWYGPIVDAGWATSYNGRFYEKTLENYWYERSNTSDTGPIKPLSLERIEWTQDPVNAGPNPVETTEVARWTGHAPADCKVAP